MTELGSTMAFDVTVIELKQMKVSILGYCNEISGMLILR
ncbi:protein of unknown function [Paenibacillus alvei]|uniref:Uncharacterized protein n=1 Tax=Paenibacillus alvei TaxID=44250 RepID=A0A383RC34_PAEAL|nr:protein of unknown function [Paenibacillus alvei]